MSPAHDSIPTKMQELKSTCPFLSASARYATFGRIGYHHKHQLSSAGWYFNNTNNSQFSVKCPFCLLEVVLNPDDDPWAEHQKFSPDCEFVRLGKLDDNAWTANETISLAMRCATMEKYTELWSSIEKLEADNQLLDRREGITKKLIEIRSSARFLTYSHRLRTLKNYPHDKTRGATCTSRKLARAGWYSTTSRYSPYSAKCPFCLLELEFDPNDNPWKEHEQRQPDCYFVKLGKMEERRWSMSEALLLAVRCAMMRKYESVMWFIEEMENDEKWNEIKEHLQLLMSKPKKRRHSL